MASGVRFSHRDMPDLNLRLPPTEVSWTYDLNTNVVDTVEGQVIQLLSINFDKLTIRGRFGREGAHGAAFTHSSLAEREPQQFRNITRQPTPNDPYLIGLAQMTEWFRTYFELASQGGRKKSGAYGHYNSYVVKVRYSIDDAKEALAQGIQSDGEWKVYPISMPSYKRSNENFAPEWEVQCEVVEPDFALKTTAVDAELKRLKEVHFGYVPFNPFSDPLGAVLGPNFLADYRNGKLSKSEIAKATVLAEARLTEINNQIWDSWRNMMPAMNQGDLEELIFFSASRPLTSIGDPRPGATNTKDKKAAPAKKGKQIPKAKDTFNHR